MTTIKTGTPSVDFAKLYDDHSEYTARRIAGSLAHAQIELETLEFKIPQLRSLIPAEFSAHSILEIGCATGELIGNFPTPNGGRRWGNDISAENIKIARKRFPDVSFADGDFRDQSDSIYDCIILSDVLEHVEDDVEFLAAAARRCSYVLVNLPLENNWLNRRRAYGPMDLSGHLRKYSISQGLSLFQRADLEIVNYRQIWAHEQPFELQRRELRNRFEGQDYSGPAISRFIKRKIVHVARTVPPFGRRLFASNLFAIARRTVA